MTDGRGQTDPTRQCRPAKAWCLGFLEELRVAFRENRSRRLGLRLSGGRSSIGGRSFGLSRGGPELLAIFFEVAKKPLEGVFN